MATRRDEADLSKVIERLLAERDINILLHRHAQATDASDGEAWGDVFVEDGVYETRFPGGPIERNTRTQGRAALVAYGSRPRSLGKHCLFNVVITLTSDSHARAESSWLLLRAGGSDLTISTHGRYYDELTRGEDGKWRFALRTAFIDFLPPA
jgi:hypothetical protein